MDQITTITFFRFDSLASKFWAFNMMQFAHPHLKNLPGQTTYKLMGSGKDGGFNPLPDWSVYCLLQVWENMEAADDFFRASRLIEKYRHHTSEIWTIYMKNIIAKGKWSGRNPFQPSSSLSFRNPLLAVITRGTVKPAQLWRFWKYVPTSQRPLQRAEGLIYTKGIAEVPIVQIATFSIWKDLEAVKRFAYGTEDHLEAVRKTRELNWYKEELFSRFQPFRSVGSWHGKEMLPNLNG